MATLCLSLLLPPSAALRLSVSEGAARQGVPRGAFLSARTSRSIALTMKEEPSVQSWYDVGIRLQTSPSPEEPPTPVQTAPEAVEEPAQASIPEPPPSPPPPAAPEAVVASTDDSEALLKEASVQWTLLSKEASQLLSSIGNTGKSFSSAFSQEAATAELNAPSSAALESSKKSAVALADWAKLVMDGQSDAAARTKLETSGNEFKTCMQNAAEVSCVPSVAPRWCELCYPLWDHLLKPTNCHSGFETTEQGCCFGCERRSNIGGHKRRARSS